MTTALETIPADEEGATLLPKPKTTGIRRVVVAAAVASFGLLAATAVSPPPEATYVLEPVSAAVAALTAAASASLASWCSLRLTCAAAFSL